VTQLRHKNLLAVLDRATLARGFANRGQNPCEVFTDA
jgi:hypothetical protein